MGIPQGALFHRTKRREGSKTAPSHAVAATVGEWIKGLKVGAEGVAPNHGWRHRFKTVAIEIGMLTRVSDAIQAHVARTAGEGYGDVALRARHEAIARMPRYQVQVRTD